MKLSLKTLAVIFTAAMVVSCGMRGNKETETCFTAIEEYLAEEIGTQYSSGEVCIPFQNIIGVDDSQKEDIQVWGDFWVDNYNVSGDTLVFVSGGNHPGKMHVKQDGEGHFSVIGFEAVGDGSTFLPTAKTIFGDKFEAFQKEYSNHEKREEIRKNAIADYVAKKGLAVKVYKDYGWPAVEIPKGNR